MNKLYDFYQYRKYRKLLNYRSPGMTLEEFRFIKKRREKKITELEGIYPDFYEAYERIYD